MADESWKKYPVERIKKAQARKKRLEESTVGPFAAPEPKAEVRRREPPKKTPPKPAAIAEPEQERKPTQDIKLEDAANSATYGEASGKYGAREGLIPRWMKRR